MEDFIYVQKTDSKTNVGSGNTTKSFHFVKSSSLGCAVYVFY